MKIKITESAINDALRLNISGTKESVVTKLKDMIHKSALVTHDMGNRRYDKFVLNIMDDKLLEVHRYQMSKGNPNCGLCQGTGRKLTFVKCSHCSGLGCTNCNFYSTIKKIVNCNCN